MRVLVFPGSVWRGLLAMRPSAGKVNWAVRRAPRGRFWLHAWTPRFHEGRGPYFSLGLGVVAVYRGY